jgi:hypothetical protein
MFLLIGPEQGIARYDGGQHQSKLPPVAEVLREVSREVVVKAAGLGGASDLNVARRHRLVARFPE